MRARGPFIEMTKTDGTTNMVNLILVKRAWPSSASPKEVCVEFQGEASLGFHVYLMSYTDFKKALENAMG